ncbi:hypothetical protein FS837_011743 [Tulasnella sp. UAMH 9824]|nr:hypothetical protein FS837_011743 [Tulasnella sp. UAMH 9824]
MTTLSDSFSSFLTTTFPNEYKTPAPPRLQALYSDVYRQKHALESAVKKGKQPQPQPQPQSHDHLGLHASDNLAEALGWDKVGRPIGLGAVLGKLAAYKTIIALPKFLKGAVSIHYQPSLAYRVASFLVGRPLRIHRIAVHAAVVQAELDMVVLKGATLSHLDVGVSLKDLERDVQVVMVQKNAVKLVESADAEAIAEGSRRWTLPTIHLLERSEKFSGDPLLQKAYVGPTMDGMVDVLVTHEEIEGAIGLGNDLAASSAGVPKADDDELKDGLEMLVEEQMKEEDEKNERIASEEKRGWRRRRRGRGSGTLRLEEDEVRRKLEEVEVSPEADLRKDWERRYDEARAKKATQPTRDDRRSS